MSINCERVETGYGVRGEPGVCNHVQGNSSCKATVFFTRNVAFQEGWPLIRQKSIHLCFDLHHHVAFPERLASCQGVKSSFSVCIKSLNASLKQSSGRSRIFGSGPFSTLATTPYLHQTFNFNVNLKLIDENK